VAQPGKSACSGNRRSPVRIRPPRPGRPAGLRVHLGGARPGGRAHQSIGAGAISRAPARSSPCPGGPGTVLRTRMTRFNSSQGGLLCLCSGGSRRKPPKLDDPGSTPGRGTMQRGTVPGEAHTLPFEGSTPSSATATTRGEGRLPYGRPRGFDSPRRDCPLGVAQLGRAPAPGAGDWGFESLHPDHSRGTSELVNAPVPQTVVAGFDPLVPHHAGVAQWQEATALEAVQCGFDSLRRHDSG
jgi:hypothetical protein